MQKDLRRLAGKTFVHGFVKGLGAPGMLNALNAMPAIPNLEPVKAPKTWSMSLWRPIGTKLARTSTA